MEQKINFLPSLPLWYLKDNPYNDVVISTRVRISRNIEGFPFVKSQGKQDLKKVSSLLFDILKENKELTKQSYWDLDYEELSSFQDCSFLPTSQEVFDNPFFSEIYYSKNNKDTCVLVNSEEHIKISSLASGLDIENPYKKCLEIEENIKKHIGFSKDKEFGYLSSKLNESGTGLRSSFRIFVPCLIKCGDYTSLLSMLKEKNCCIKKVYLDSRKNELSSCVFDIFLNNSLEGSCEEQNALISTIAKLVVEKERKLRAKVADNYPTIVLNQIRQQQGKAKDSLLLEYFEGLNIILAIKLGHELKLIQDISETDLNSLCYIIKGEMLRSLLYKNDISFEKDVKENYLLEQRLRAIVIKNALTGIINAN